VSFLAELRRRNVIRMAGLYLVGAWLATQVAATLLPVFDAPAWAMKAVVAETDLADEVVDPLAVFLRDPRFFAEEERKLDVLAYVRPLPVLYKAQSFPISGKAHSKPGPE
jgi:hypothetical protein